MSLLEFPPLDEAETSYCIQELNGRLVYGSKDDVDIASKNELLRDYPTLDKGHLHCLEHALSRENVRQVFRDVKNNKFSQAYDIWNKKGAKGVLGYITNMSEGTRFGWPIAKFTNAVRQAEEGLKKVLASSSENTVDVIAKTVNVLNWRSNWIRCIACSSDGERLAICQFNDYIRVYLCDGLRKAPITLKHPQQKDVTDMAWKPYDQFALAVACSTVIIVWRFAQQKLANRVSSQFAQVVELPSTFIPGTQCIWDKSLSSTLFVTSPSCSQILIMDAASGESLSVGSWFGSRVRHVSVSPNGSSILVAYQSNVIRVYDRDTWKEETWSKLNGECISAVWSPDSSFFYFSCEKEALIRVIRFVTRIEVSAVGERIPQRYGVAEALVVFDVEKVESDLNSDDCTVSAFGGIVRDMQLSPDGQRLAVSFRDNGGTIALFIADDNPKIRLTPCGIINGYAFGNAALTLFLPKFSYGSLLAVIWSDGFMQYIPLLYGASAEVNSKAIKLVLSSSDSYRSDDNGLLEELAPEAVESGVPYLNTNGATDNGNEIPELFTSAGLYDRLLTKSATESKSNK